MVNLDIFTSLLARLTRIRIENWHGLHHSWSWKIQAHEMCSMVVLSLHELSLMNLTWSNNFKAYSLVNMGTMQEPDATPLETAKQEEKKKKTPEEIDVNAIKHTGQLALRKLYHESKRPIVVFYSAPGCGPCRTLKPIVNGVIDEFDTQVWHALDTIDCQSTICWCHLCLRHSHGLMAVVILRYCFAGKGRISRICLPLLLLIL